MLIGPEPSDVLLTFAEIAVAFAGFSSVVAIFQRQSDAGVSYFDRFRFWVMLEHSLAALFFALLPLPLSFLGLSDAATWSVGGLGLVGFVLAHVLVTRGLARRGEAVVVGSLRTWTTALASTVYSIIILSQLANLVASRSFGPYLLGVFLLLFGSGVNFVLLLAAGSPGEGPPRTE